MDSQGESLRSMSANASPNGNNQPQDDAAIIRGDAWNDDIGSHLRSEVHRYFLNAQDSRRRNLPQWEHHHQQAIDARTTYLNWPRTHHADRTVNTRSGSKYKFADLVTIPRPVLWCSIVLLLIPLFVRLLAYLVINQPYPVPPRTRDLDLTTEHIRMDIHNALVASNETLNVLGHYLPETHPALAAINASLVLASNASAKSAGLHLSIDSFYDSLTKRLADERRFTVNAIISLKNHNDKERPSLRRLWHILRPKNHTLSLPEECQSDENCTTLKDLHYQFRTTELDDFAFIKGVYDRLVTTSDSILNQVHTSLVHVHNEMESLAASGTSSPHRILRKDTPIKFWWTDTLIDIQQLCRRAAVELSAEWEDALLYTRIADQLPPQNQPHPSLTRVSLGSLYSHFDLVAHKVDSSLKSYQNVADSVHKEYEFLEVMFGEMYRNVALLQVRKDHLHESWSEPVDGWLNELKLIATTTDSMVTRLEQWHGYAWGF